MVRPWCVMLAAIALSGSGVGRCLGATSDVTAAARGLAGRLLGQRAGEFAFAPIPRDNGRDVFEVEAADGQVMIRGSGGVAMASGLNWYLTRKAHCQVSLYGSQVRLPAVLPDVRPAYRRVSPHRYRYLLNYCAFGYSLPWWDWPRWERLIDWMALSGINMPLAVTGEEAVWQAVGRRLGLTDAEMSEFLAGPPFLPFAWMGCLDGWGGPLPRSWITRHAALERRILSRERELGMTPVLQGFTGHVPQAITRVRPDAQLRTIRWIEWETAVLEPTSPAFRDVGRMFLEEQQRLYGTSHLYASDTFIEMTPPSGEPGYLAELSRSILRSMTDVDPEAVWVLQGWIFVNNPSFWTEERARAFFDAVPDDRMVVLDLFCESSPAWTKTRAFYGKPWLWCIVQNFGRTVRLEGNLPKINADLPAAVASSGKGRLSGIGIVCEGLDYNPIVFDFMGEMAWRAQPADLESWVKDYATARYGVADRAVSRAWLGLQRTVYSANGASDSDIASRPSLEPDGGAGYDTSLLLDAWRRLLSRSGRLGEVETYRFDVVNIGRQVLSNLLPRFHADAADAVARGDSARLEAAAASYAELVRDMDRLLATREEFLLGRELEYAKRWGATSDERARCEWNARTVITLWGDGRALNDYARKEWAGLLSGLYLRRWEILVDHLRHALREGKPFDEAACADDQFAFEKVWTRAGEGYPAEPVGDSVEVARELLAKYGPCFGPDAPSLTTGKPVTCSRALPPFPPELANDGITWDTNRYWATDVADGSPAWWQVDLLAPTVVSRVIVVGYYGDRRQYGFTVEGSGDGKTWRTLADRGDNAAPATRSGYVCDFPPVKVRWLRVTQTSNSANTGRHLVEVEAYGP